MNKKRLIIIEIFITILFVIISIPVWVKSEHKLDYNEEILAYEEGLTLYYLNNYKSEEVISLDKVSNITELLIYNISNDTNNGQVVLNYNKNSNLDYKYLNIVINDQQYTLSELYIKSNNNYDIFKISDINLNSYNSTKYNIILKINDTAFGNDVINKNYKYQFAIIK